MGATVVSVSKASTTRPTSFRWAFTALFVVFLGLLARHATDPWQYVHDDNGALYSAVARAHLMRGLANTRGQDFLVERATGELAPYLHHPPLLGLYLAAVFAAVGDDSPAVARFAVVAVHSGSFVVFLLIARALLRANARARLWAAFVFAVTPMSVYFGKMPNHEPLSLCFLLVGCFAYLRYVHATRRHSPYLYVGALAWLLAAFSSWHALFVMLGVSIHAFVWTRGAATTFGWMTISSATAVTLLVITHILWVNEWTLLPDQWPRIVYWASAPDDSAALPFLWRCLRRMYRYSRRGYANVPWMLAVAWLGYVAAQRLRGRRVRSEQGFVLTLAAGTAVYSTVFHRAVHVHAYQAFYLLPFVGLASGLLLDDVVERVSAWSRAAARSLMVAAALLTIAYSWAYTSEQYASVSEYAVRTTRRYVETYY